jgi:hypothetical protein
MPSRPCVSPSQAKASQYDLDSSRRDISSPCGKGGSGEVSKGGSSHFDVALKSCDRRCIAVTRDSWLDIVVLAAIMHIMVCLSIAHTSRRRGFR